MANDAAGRDDVLLEWTEGAGMKIEDGRHALTKTDGRGDCFVDSKMRSSTS